MSWKTLSVRSALGPGAEGGLMAAARKRGFIGSPRELSFWSLLGQKLVVWAGDLYGLHGGLMWSPFLSPGMGLRAISSSGSREKGYMCDLGGGGMKRTGLLHGEEKW